MPNSFPGMNPYLENPHRWRDVHGALIYGFRDELNAALPSSFAVFVEERVYVQEVAKEYVADALVVESFVPLTNGNGGGGTATLTRLSERTEVQTALYDLPRRLVFSNTIERERFLEVRSADKLDEVVAVVEFLSPKNKTAGVGRAAYKRKQQDLLQSDVHLLEIDLLRAGPFTLAPPEAEARRQLGRFDYLISLHHAATGTEYDLWPVLLRDRLPRLYLPLTGEEKAVVDLQAVLEWAYRNGQYDRSIDYTKPPVPPLAPDDAQWANERIAKKHADTNGTNGTIETKDF